MIYQYTGEECEKSRYTTTVTTKCGRVEVAAVRRPENCAIAFDVLTPKMCSFDSSTYATHPILSLVRYVFILVVAVEVIGAIINYVKAQQFTCEIIPFYSFWYKVFGCLTDGVLVLINNSRANAPRF